MADSVYADHALKEMARNNTTTDDVRVVVDGFDDMYEHEPNGRSVYRRTMAGGRALVVVMEVDGITVVTAWLDRRASRRGQRWR